MFRLFVFLVIIDIVELISTCCNNFPLVAFFFLSLFVPSFRFSLISIEYVIYACAPARAQLCLTVWNPMDCSPPESSVSGIF